MAQIISGKEVALKVRERIKNEVEELFAKIEHEYESKITKNATCKEEGVKTFKCVNCEATYEEKIGIRPVITISKNKLGGK